ncbi:MAG TPA: DUF6152 family protein [Gammaproteobacteria bacterium]|nr:DUF6152 family protein [Gammaproteobacteria bacterium]
MLRVSVFVGSLLLPVAGFTHHSVAAWFDPSEITELEGELTELRWQNPHIVFTLKITDDAGQETLWDMESLSVSGVSRTGLTPELFVVGQTLKVAGNPSRKNLNNVFVRNILLPSGEEIVLGGQARWSAERSIRGSEILTQSEGNASAPNQGIFRVWSTGSGTSMIFPENLNASFDFSVYPLTAAARAAVEAFDIFEDDPTKDCVPKGMPLLMEQPYPMEFVQRGDDIVLRLEEYDSVRTIHMNAVARAAQQPAAALGYSVGRWDDRTLMVTTTRINSGHFDSVGIPLSEAAEIVERFTPSEDGARLDYQMTVTDLATFTRPVALSKHWIWLPEIKLGRYACSPQ